MKAVLLVGLVACAHPAAVPPPPGNEAAEPAITRCHGDAPACLPDVELIDTAGVAHDPSGDVVLLYFFTGWCAPCAEDFPGIGSLARDGVTVLGVALDEVDPIALGIGFPVIPMTPELVELFGMPANVPTLYVYDRGGTRRVERVGFKDPDELRATIARLRR